MQLIRTWTVSRTFHQMPHVMFSYNWDHQALVLEVVQVLKSKGVDVWVDVQGSSCLGKMAGSTDEMMIKAVNLSSHVVVFVSKKYLASANCNQELRYARQQEKAGKLKLIYVMLERDCTPFSRGAHGDHVMWLYMGEQLFYSLMGPGDVQEVALELLQLLPKGTESSGGGTASASAAAEVECQRKAEQVRLVEADPQCIVHNGYAYKSLAGHSPHSKQTINENGKLYPLDPAWQLCPNTPDALHVCASYPWAAYALVFADGSAHYTKEAQNSGVCFSLVPGAKADSNRLRQVQDPLPLYGVYDVRYSYKKNAFSLTFFYDAPSDVLLRRSLD
jgi:hypothetical protein